MFLGTAHDDPPLFLPDTLLHEVIALIGVMGDHGRVHLVVSRAQGDDIHNYLVLHGLVALLDQDARGVSDDSLALLAGLFLGLAFKSFLGGFSRALGLEAGRLVKKVGVIGGVDGFDEIFFAEAAFETCFEVHLGHFALFLKKF